MDPWGLCTPSLGERIGERVQWQIETSGIEDILNAPPWHPIHWKEDVLWFIFYPFMDTDYGFFEPWGHPFLGDDPCEH